VTKSFTVHNMMSTKMVDEIRLAPILTYWIGSARAQAAFIWNRFGTKIKDSMHRRKVVREFLSACEAVLPIVGDGT
jgi:hypothetical protein